jgi:hypothetical protein
VKKKNNTYPFLNIIKKEKYDNFTEDEKEKYLFDNKIYVPYEDLDHPFFNQPNENGKTLRDSFFSSHYVSNIVLREMVDWFVEIGSDFKTEFEGYKERIHSNINRALDNSDKERVIRNEHEKHSDFLSENYYSVEDFYSINTRDGDLYDCIRSYSIFESLVIEYISDGFPFLSTEYPFKDCDEIKYNLEVLKFLKEEMNKITDSKEEKVYKPKPITPLPFNDEIFRTIEAQDWFFNTLNKMGGLEESYTPKKRKFQPICHAIFYSLDCKKKIFRYNLELKDYILFLNSEFDTNINSKLSIGYRHVDEVEELLFNTM